MKPFAFFFVALLAMGLLPLTAAAQSCPDTTPITCGATITGDTIGQTSDSDSVCSSFGGAGPDANFVFTAASDGDVYVAVDTDYDVVLEVLPDNAGDCDITSCIESADSTITGTESLTFPAAAVTTYHIVVDGYGGASEGNYALSLYCIDTLDCQDVDEDGYDGFDASTCPMGDDCCDTGDETVDGCTADTAAAINPDAEEVCGDGIDNDCADGDEACPYCDPGTLTIGRDESVDGDTTAGDALDLIDSWDNCGSFATSAANPEVAYSFTLTDTSPVTISLAASFDSVLVLLEDNAGCDPTACLDLDDTMGDGGETIVTLLQAGTYYIVVDGWGNSTVNEGSFTLTVDCSEVCEDLDGDGVPGYDADYCPSGTDCDDTEPTIFPGAEDLCGDEIDQDCSGTANAQCGETCTDLTSDPLFCGDCDTDCTALTTGVDMALCNLGICDYDSCATGFYDCDENRSNGCETAEDAANCGACAYDCADYLLNVADMLCEFGACDYLNCQPGFLDCNDARNDGCELPEDVDNCGACGFACATDAGFENAEGFACAESACSWTSCVGDFGDCDDDLSNACETPLNTNENCGGCGVQCERLENCVQLEGAWTCSATCADADSDGRADAACGGNDCDDTDANVYPGAAELCNGVDDDCDGNIDEGFDADSDGYKTCGDEADCDDSDPNVNPGASEICGNAVDENCDGTVVESCESCVDADFDGAEDAACGGTDCNDSDPNVGPNSPEICDNVDNNCDGQVDENDVCFQGGQGCDCSTADPVPFTGGFMMLLLGWAAFRRRGQ